MLTFNFDRQTKPDIKSVKTPPAGKNSVQMSAKQASLVRNVLETREVRQLLGNIIPEVIMVWAGKSRIKRWIASMISRVLRIGFFQPGEGKYESLLGDENVIKDAGPAAERVAQGADQLTDACSAAFASLSLEDKARMIQRLIGSLFNGRSSNLLTQLMAALNEIHDQEPEFLAQALEPGIRDWIAKTDFGELKELGHKSGQDFKAVVGVINDNLWQYPAKVILLLSLLPDAANMLTTCVKDSLTHFNEISPDVVADITLTLLNEIDGAELGRGLNELTELVRKLATGSALIGEPAFPKMPQDVSRLLEDILNTLDGGKWLKANLILAEQKQVLHQCFLDQLKERPELLLEKWGQYSNLKNILMRRVHHQLTILDEIPDDEVAEAFKKGIDDLDTDTLTDAVHLLITLISRVHDTQPDVFPDLAAKLIDGLDLDTIAESTDELLNVLMPELVFLGRPFLPRMLNGLCDAMEPKDDGYETDMADARKRLRNMLLQEEV